MKCPHCGNNHSDFAKFCDVTGKPLGKACQNEDCPDYGKNILPLETRYCPRCGHPCGEDIEDEAVQEEIEKLPFHERHSEYDLVPWAEFKFNNKISFWFNTPEYIEDIRSLNEGNNFLWIARKGKLGVLKLYYKKGFFHSDYVASRIISCKYDMIEDRGDYYLCYEGNKKVMFDRRGTQIE